MTTFERGANGAGATKGVFANIDEATRAVRMLAEESVPADSIRVLLLDTRGEEMRELPVEDEAGALRGALIGAGIGFGVGLVVVGITSVVSIGTGVDVALSSFVGAFGAVAAVTAACVPLGALWGMGRWRSRAKMSARDHGVDHVAVVVESEELANEANRVLAEAGALAILGPTTGRSNGRGVPSPSS